MVQPQNELAQASYRCQLQERIRNNVTGALRRLVPFWQRRMLRSLYLMPWDVADTLAGRRKKLVPPRYLNFVGGGDFEKIGDEFLGYFVELGGLRPGSHILEIGCGIGRMARPLTRFLTTGSYDGVDIVIKGIRWCQKNITARYPNFRFQVADVYNKEYNPRGRHRASEYRFPFAEGAFDFVFLSSVFTHMLPPDMKNYLHEIARVLGPGGTSLITFFLLNDESRQLQSRGASSIELIHKFGEAWAVDKATPEAAIGYDEQAILTLYRDLGLRPQTVRYGGWCGRRDCLSYQDLVVAAKR
jgi:SAM-dependent methyltransferase